MVDIFGKILQVILISRRSRIFAGTRFLKRGVNEQGYVANDVETEQILYEPNNGHLIHEHFSSCVQHRGSIPLFWAQDSSNNIIPKPPITSKYRYCCVVIYLNYFFFKFKDWIRSIPRQFYILSI